MEKIIHQELLFIIEWVTKRNRGGKAKCMERKKCYNYNSMIDEKK